MKKSNIIAWLLLLLVVPLFVMAYIPFVHDIRRNVAIHHGNEVLSRVRWYVEEFKRAPKELYNAHVPLEDRGPEVFYAPVPEDSMAFRLGIRFGKQDSVLYDSRVGDWK